MSLSHPLSTRPQSLRKSTKFAVSAVVATCSIAPGLVPATAASTSLGAPRVAGQSTTITTTVTDADDTYGPLDIARVSHRIYFTRPRGRVRLTYAVTTYSPFDAGSLNSRQRRFVVELDTDGQRGSERNVRISARHGELTADVISNATRKVIATVDVDRVDAHDLRITGPRRLIGARRYFWYSDFHADRSRHCGRIDGYPVTCQDDVPEIGWIRLDHPAWPRDPGVRA